MQGYTLYTVYNFNNNNMYGITCVKILIIIISYFRKMSGIINPINRPPLPKLPAKLSELMDYKMCEEVKRTSTIFLLPGWRMVKSAPPPRLAQNLKHRP